MVVRITTVLAWSVVAGCSGGNDDVTEDTDTTETEPTEETGTQEDDFTGKEGSVVLVHYAGILGDDEYYEGQAVFLDDAMGVVNLAHCWPGEINGPQWSTCVASYPPSGTADDGADGSFVAYADTYEVDPLLVGSTPNALAAYPYVTQFDWYWDSISGWGGNGILSFDGDYAPYDGDNDFAYPTQIVVTAPDPAEALSVGPDDIVTLTWEPASDGMVLLEWGATVTVLEDDGSHDFAVADLDAASPIGLEYLRLSRVIDTDVDAAGNTIHVQTRSEQVLELDVLDVEDYAELELPDDVAESCDDAGTLPPLGPGLYYGNLGIADDDEDPGDSNDLTGWPAPGNDVVARIDLLAGQTLTVEYWNLLDGSMYLLTDSCDPDDGLVGADDEYYDEPEQFDWEADADGPVYLVLDSYFEGGFFYWVDIQIEDPAL